MTEVVAALIWNNGRFLICQRPENKSRPLLWEFVGGKIEDGETPQDALLRECVEELDVIVNVEEEFMTVVHEYSDITINLKIFNAKIVKGVPKLIEHAEMKWITPKEISNYEFCPADKEILTKILKTTNG